MSLNTSVPTPSTPHLTLQEIEADLKAFETREKKRLGIVDDAIEHWFDANPQRFTRAERASTTLLFGGLTDAQDFLIGGALEGLGYKVRVLDTPDNEALRFGKEFGNRGQCNPTYFTVGNLIKYLAGLEAGGMNRAQIITDYLFVTAGACGPCRFGTYATEYRKALRDAGFDGFRVLLLDNNGGLRQACGEELGLELNQPFFLGLLRALLVGDLLNVVAYRIRPYEREAGATNAAIARCKDILRAAFRDQRSIVLALRRCRKVLASVKVDHFQIKPKVSVIGEFWAMTTEGDGNYHLQRFLEQEGAEVDAQMVMAWVMYQVWQNRWDTKRRMLLRRSDHARMGLGDKDARKKLWLLRIAEWGLVGTYRLYAWALGLKHHEMPSMDEIATLSHAYYDNHLRGGEGHMEVGKVIQTAKKRKAHMVISIKPFGCMPSSGVSDGVQSLVSERYPDAIFCAVETTGDAAIMLHSRVQMQLFKARELAVAEFDRALAKSGLTRDAARARINRMDAKAPLAYPKIKGIAGTVARLIAQIPLWRRRTGARSITGKPAASPAE